MKAEIQIDTKELAGQITQEVIRAIRPLLSRSKADAGSLFTVESLAEYLSVTHQWVYERVQPKKKKLKVRL